MNNCEKDIVFVIASSYRRDLIGLAVRCIGHLEQIIYIPIPEEETRESIFQIHYIADRPTFGDIDYKVLAKMTEKYVTWTPPIS